MEAFILGTGGMMPLPHRHLTSLLLRRAGELFLFDCGEGTQVSFRRLNLKWKKISAIFISHTHADHVTGLPGMLMLSSQVERKDPLVIIGPPKIRDYIESNRRVLDMYINYPIEIREIEQPWKAQEVFHGEGYSVRSFPLWHSKVCVGYRLEENPRPGIFQLEKAVEKAVPKGPLWGRLQSGKTVTLEDGRRISPQDVLGPSRRGRKVSYVTDTGWRESILPEVANSDLLICEAMFAENLADSAQEKKHLTAKQAGKLALGAGGVKRMGLIHYSPRYTNRELDVLAQECSAVFRDSFLCWDRMHLPIPHEEDLLD